jgi:hypothetical protein
MEQQGTLKWYDNVGMVIVGDNSIVYRTSRFFDKSTEGAKVRFSGVMMTPTCHVAYNIMLLDQEILEL